MKKLMTLAAIAATATTAHADVFAIAGMAPPDKGRTILTTEPCALTIDAAALKTTPANVENMRRVFYYLNDGRTEEGCWKYDAETVVLAWPASNILTRRPLANFTLKRRAGAAAWGAL
jgi:hypothetical protein